jgi:hypothetical protein
MIADLDTLLTALYVELTDRIIPSLGPGRLGPGKPPEVTDAELVCLAVAQVLLRYNDERHWLRGAGARGAPVPPAAAPKRVQRPGQRSRAADGGRAAVARRSHAGVSGNGAADGRHPCPVRPVARIVQRLLALNACIWLSWQTGAPVKRSPIAHDHE